MADSNNRNKRSFDSGVPPAGPSSATGSDQRGSIAQDQNKRSFDSGLCTARTNSRFLGTPPPAPARSAEPREPSYAQDVRKYGSVRQKLRDGLFFPNSRF